MNLRDLKLRARALFSPRREERDLDEELAFHIERETQKHIANGLSPAEARMRARTRFGSVAVTADECRDARGTAFIDSLKRDVSYAWRSFRRAPLVALTIVTTVGLGLGLVAVVFTILNAFVFLPDEVRNPHELFAVQRQGAKPSESEGPGDFTREQYEALVRETGVFSDAFAIGPEIDRWIDGRRMEGALVTGNFFHVLGATALRGRTIAPADDEAARQTIVLSHRAWTRHFASDPGVLTRPVLVNGVPFQVIGVMPERFRGLTVVAPDFWAPLSLLGQFRRIDEGGRTEFLQVIGRLTPGLSRGQAISALQAWDARQHPVEVTSDRPASDQLTSDRHPSDRSTSDRPTSDRSIPDRSTTNRTAASVARFVLEPKPGTVPLSAETMVMFMPLFFAFGLILLIGCANVANLLLARAVVRQREIGIRLAIGASRRRIIWQLLTESLLLALVSAALGFAISRLALQAVVYAIATTWPPDIGDIRLAVPPADWRVAVFLLAGAMLSTLVFALVPALQATRFELVRAMRGEVIRDARPGRARNALLTIQVTASVLLLICSAVFLRSAMAAADVDPGIRTSDIVTMEIVNEQMRDAALDIVRREPSVAAIAASWPGGLGGRTAVAESVTGTAGKSTVTYQFVTPEYFGVLGIDLVRGRGFTQTERSSSAAVAIISESVARQLWPDRDPLGQPLRLDPDANATHTSRGPREKDDPVLLSRTAVVIGIARDVAGFKLGGTRLAAAGVYVPIGAETAKTSLQLRVHGDADRARRVLAERLDALAPNIANVSTLRTLATMEAFLLGIPFWLTLVLGALALVLTLSGLFSVLSYLVEQRTREIGVRMTLGATRSSISMLVLSQSARPIVIGLFLGGTLTASLGLALLATPAAEQIGASIRLFDPVAYVISVTTIVIACVFAALLPARRAGGIDPVAALRQG
jgi:predicted permease